MGGRGARVAELYKGSFVTAQGKARNGWVRVCGRCLWETSLGEKPWRWLGQPLIPCSCFYCRDIMYNNSR
jgi:hypothetical protein